MTDKESVPPMLKSSAKTAVNILSNDNFSVISGQESMEAFLNMSQSKGIDSFINLGEPEFNDPLINMSQPSILYASIISPLNESTFIENSTISVINKNAAQNDVKEESNSNNNETFVMQNADDTFTLDKMYCTNTLSNICKESVQLDKGLNETYDTEALIEMSAPQSNLHKEVMVTMSSTFVTEPNADTTFVHLSNEVNNDVKPLDTTYLSLAKDAERGNSPVSIESDTYKPTMRQADLNVTCDIPSAESAANVLDISFKVPINNQSTPMNTNVLNPISKHAMKHLDQPRQAIYSTLKAPTSLRRELLAEIQRSDERKWDSTYNHIPSDHLGSRDTKENIRVVCNEDETDILPLNRYQTYKKSVLTNQCRSQKETAQGELPADQRKFYTFTKKSNNNPLEKTDAIANENAEMRLNRNDTFCKPLPPKAQQKRNIPRMLSKLPKFLQKSNPNLVSSSLRAASGASAGYASISSVGYIKGSQPDIVGQRDIAERSQLPSNKLHPYGKLKSGSEQRLLEQDNTNTNIQFPIKCVITAGSTESIESTQSAHSAPDLDDRLSTCSDSSSHNSCNRRTMNIEQLHQLVRMQEESLKQDSTPKPHIRVLENTWVEAKTDMPSPILKNGVEYDEIDRHSLNNDLRMKCSSPIVSPTGSSHALNNDGNPEGNVTKTKDEVVIVGKTEGPNQVVPKIENKTRLRQPTNWSTGSKPAAVISGIPRPASRIPALRFVRPNTKTAQADLRKGYT
ncbi:ras guanine nucleotide exchange factor e-like protein [Lasius niger]|uniref:Ras guanine nucleotide exchange factor e-like protein n=1 Tax=Lasius niger TaxID=67767 RepID=A0A0J7L9D0_LASNI|nr:ras guanine nucleotide exchange factor e-like protein [Lasius niger]